MGRHRKFRSERSSPRSGTEGLLESNDRCTSYCGPSVLFAVAGPSDRLMPVRVSSAFAPE